MKILYIGSKSGNSLNKYKSFKKIYKNIDFLNTDNFFPFNRFTYPVFYRFNYFFFDYLIYAFYLKKVLKKYDLIFFFNVPFINKKSFNYLKKQSKKIVFYCSDNPFLKRDKNLWLPLLSVIKKFDLLIFQQKNRIKYAKEFKLKNYVVFLPSVNFKFYKEIKFRNTNYKRNISFVGTWFPERGKFFYDLYKLGLKFQIYGSLWNKDKKYYKYIKHFINLGHVNLTKYRKIVSESKINLCLFSKGNDDDVTERCSEIASFGGLLCSERTLTMKKIFRENKEAIYFKNAKECKIVCNNILKNERKLRDIASNGNERIKQLNANDYEILKKIINITFDNEKTPNKFIFKF